jgi:hypothetical protein
MAMHPLYAWVFTAWLARAGLRYVFAPVVTVFDPDAWHASRFAESRARVYVPIARVGRD